jgi:hypothetical protein
VGIEISAGFLRFFHLVHGPPEGVLLSKVSQRKIGRNRSVRRFRMGEKRILCSIFGVLVTVGTLFPLAAVAATPPAAVSPGWVDVVVPVESRCPTFSWSAVEDATGYELVVYRIEERVEAGRAILYRHFKGSVSSWTPSLGDSLERGGQYAWAVRARGTSTASDWSQPSLFQVTAGPSQRELEEALAVVGQYLDEEAIGSDKPSPASSWPASDRTRAAFPVPGYSEVSTLSGRHSKPDSPQDETAAAAASATGVAALTVEGEVRTVDPSSAPRLWGQGRPGTDVYLKKDSEPPSLCRNGDVRFGLSKMVVTWGEAADACPAGTWVCTAEERGTAACDTLRPDSSDDAFTCDGVYLDWPSNGHWGWLADAGITLGSLVIESGVGVATFPCISIPVWCCSE